LLAAACSTEATVTRLDGLSLEARMIASDANNIQTRSRDGRETRITRAQLADVDHPGNGMAVAGVCLLGMAGWLSAAGGTAGEAIANGIILGLPGAVMLSWGGVVYRRSTQASRRFDEETTRLRTPDPNRPYLPAPTWPVAVPPASAPEQPLVPASRAP
jgi:hypothetical protein